MFQRLVGDRFHPRVLLVATMSEIAKPHVVEKRKNELEGHWKEMIRNGSAVRKHDGKNTTAWEIVKVLLDKQNERL